MMWVSIFVGLLVIFYSIKVFMVRKVVSLIIVFSVMVMMMLW